MRGGFAVGIPLTLLQLGAQQYSGAPAPDAFLITNNFLLAGAVYGADRLDSNSTDGQVAATRVSALVSSALLWSDPSLRPIVPLVPALHLGYASMKPYIAPVKPFVVGALWCLLVYAVPIWHARTGVAMDPLVASSIFLNIAALSHAVDVVDLEDDQMSGVYTPAVILGADHAASYAVALLFASMFLDAASAHPHLSFDLLSACALLGILLKSPALVIALVSTGVVTYASTHALEVLQGVLSLTNTLHETSIDLTMHSVDCAVRLPDPVRAVAIDTIFALVNGGDTIGAHLLDLYEATVRSIP